MILLTIIQNDAARRFRLNIYNLTFSTDSSKVLVEKRFSSFLRKKEKKRERDKAILALASKENSLRPRYAKIMQLQAGERLPRTPPARAISSAIAIRRGQSKNRRGIMGRDARFFLASLPLTAARARFRLSFPISRPRGGRSGAIREIEARRFPTPERLPRNMDEIMRSPLSPVIGSASRESTSLPEPVSIGDLAKK